MDNVLDLDTTSLSQELIAEFAAVEIKHRNLIIIGAYRSPNQDLNEFLKATDKLLLNITNSKKDIILMGNINVNIRLKQDPDYIKYKIVFI